MHEANTTRALVRLLRHIGAGGAMLSGEGPAAQVENADHRMLATSTKLVAQALARGLAARDGARLTLQPATRSFLRRAAAEAEEVFLSQHADIVDTVTEVDGIRQPARLDLSESPLGAVARLKDRDGAAFLPPEALAAGERLAADFTRGQLQPRVTASWEPQLSGRGKGSRGGMADLADSAMAARLSVNRAVSAMGPELSGVALDICCFAKGLTVVERERQWPARSAKLMLRAALMVLSRHYDPPRPEKPGRMRHWGDEGYRPEMG